MIDKRKAQCLCGAVQITAHIKGPEIQACHCTQCQRWTGGAALMTVRVRRVEISGEDAIRHHHASDHGERGFCVTCGTTLYWRLQGRSVAFLPVGLFDDQTGFELSEELFVDDRAPWLPAWSGTTQHTEAELVAQLNAFLKGEAS